MRVFFAIFPPLPVAQALFSLARAKALEFGGKPSRAESIHLTLAFLGDVPDERLAELIEVAKRVRAAPFEMAVDFHGYWPHNRLLWAGCAQAPEGLLILATGLRAALADANFLVDRKPGRFSPHVTLVRKVGGANSTMAPPAQASIDRIAWPCTRFELVSSPLAEAAAGYHVLASFPL